MHFLRYNFFQYGNKMEQQEYFVIVFFYFGKTVTSPKQTFHCKNCNCLSHGNQLKESTMYKYHENVLDYKGGSCYFSLETQIATPLTTFTFFIEA